MPDYRDNNEPLNDYGLLAPHYDPAYNARLGNRIDEMAVMLALVDTFHPDAQALLDLGTGTGIIPRAFSGKIGELVGLDISPEMLAIARNAVPKAVFIEANVSDFEIGKEFDVIICGFNAINHLRKFDRWESFFRSTERHLAPGGVFIFDMVTTGLMRRLSSYEEPDYWSFENGTYRLGVEQSRTNINNYVTTFTVEPDENSSIPAAVTGKLYETVYPVEEVKDAAAKHFELLLAFDMVDGFLDDGRPRPVNDNSTRPLFVYKKKYMT
jgi:SAM-dependent methyltransferase